MTLHYFTLAMFLLLLCSQSLSAKPQSAQSAQENTNKISETLNDPTAMTEELQRRLAGVFMATESKITPSPVNNADKGELKDPTRMNQNFRDALKGVSATTPGAPPGIAVQSSSLPDIKLVASVCGMHKDKNHAMLRINDKTEMVGIGDKITTIKGSKVIEIIVLEIDKGYVKVEVQPANETIFLR
ncbi:MAG: hypothetical protein ISR72_06075 [Methylobacter sp.]|nr:hypothetical protein [Methylobacter sp.]